MSDASARQVDPSQNPQQNDQNGIEQSPNFFMEQQNALSVQQKLAQLRNKFNTPQQQPSLPQQSIPFPSQNQLFQADTQAVENGLHYNNSENTFSENNSATQPVVPNDTQPQANQFYFTQPEVLQNLEAVSSSRFAHLIPQNQNISFSPDTDNIQQFQLKSQAIGSLQTQILDKVNQNNQLTSHFSLSNQPNLAVQNIPAQNTDSYPVQQEIVRNSQNYPQNEAQNTAQTQGSSAQAVAKKSLSAEESKKSKSSKKPVNTVQTAASVLSTVQGGAVAGAADFENIVLAMIGLVTVKSGEKV